MIINIFNKIIRIIKLNFYYIIFFLIIASFTNFFKNFNTLLVRGYDERILRTYGYCGGISYGYIKKIKTNYLSYDKRLYLINLDIYPSSIDLFPDLEIDENKNNVIFLNLKDTNRHKLKDINFNFSKYIFLNKEDNCYYYKKIKKND
jgi:hypothetical protein